MEHVTQRGSTGKSGAVWLQTSFVNTEKYEHPYTVFTYIRLDPCLFLHVSINSIDPSIIYLSTYLSTCQSVFLSIHPCRHPSIHPSIHPISRKCS